VSLGQPHVKQALDWILARLADHPDQKRGALVDEASREFDLTPLEADFLYRHVQESLKAEPPRASHP
jgi:hypothetical protein